MNQQEQGEIDLTDVEAHKGPSARADAKAIQGEDDVQGHVYVVEPQNPDDSRL